MSAASCVQLMSVLGARVGPVYGDRLDDGLQAVLHQGTV